MAIPSKKLTFSDFSQEFRQLNQSFHKLSKRLVTIEAFLFSKFAKELAEFQVGEFQDDKSIDSPTKARSSKKSASISITTTPTIPSTVSEGPKLVLVGCSRETNEEDEGQEQELFTELAYNSSVEGFSAVLEDQHSPCANDSEISGSQESKSVNSVPKMSRPMPKSKRVAAMNANKSRPSRKKSKVEVSSFEESDDDESQSFSGSKRRKKSPSAKPKPKHSQKNVDPSAIAAREVESDQDSQVSVINKRVRKKNANHLEWELLDEEFEDIERAKQYVSDMKYFVCKSTKYRNEWSKYYYNCKTSGCRCKVHLHVPSDSYKVQIYKTKEDHNHQGFKCFGMHPDVKKEIMLLYNTGICKPKDIMRNLSEKNVELPRLKQINTYLYHLRRIREDENMANASDDTEPEVSFKDCGSVVRGFNE